MKREKAVEISKVLDALESFEMFEDNLESFCGNMKKLSRILILSAMS